MVENNKTLTPEQILELIDSLEINDREAVVAKLNRKEPEQIDEPPFPLTDRSPLQVLIHPQTSADVILPPETGVTAIADPAKTIQPVTGHQESQPVEMEKSRYAQLSEWVDIEKPVTKYTLSEFTGFMKGNVDLNHVFNMVTLRRCMSDKRWKLETNVLLDMQSNVSRTFSYGKNKAYMLPLIPDENTSGWTYTVDDLPISSDRISPKGLTDSSITVSVPNSLEWNSVAFESTFDKSAKTVRSNFATFPNSRTETSIWKHLEPNGEVVFKHEFLAVSENTTWGLKLIQRENKILMEITVRAVELTGGDPIEETGRYHSNMFLTEFNADSATAKQLQQQLEETLTAAGNDEAYKKQVLYALLSIFHFQSHPDYPYVGKTLAAGIVDPNIKSPMALFQGIGDGLEEQLEVVANALDNSTDADLEVLENISNKKFPWIAQEVRRVFGDEDSDKLFRSVWSGITEIRDGMRKHIEDKKRELESTRKKRERLLQELNEFAISKNADLTELKIFFQDQTLPRFIIDIVLNSSRFLIDRGETTRPTDKQLSLIIVGFLTEAFKHYGIADTSILADFLPRLFSNSVKFQKGLTELQQKWGITPEDLANDKQTVNVDYYRQALETYYKNKSPLHSPKITQ